MTIEAEMKKAVDAVGSQAELARLIGVEAPTVNQWLKGVRPVPASRAVQIERVSRGAVSRVDLCPKFPWEDIGGAVRQRSKAAAGKGAGTGLAASPGRCSGSKTGVSA